MLQLHIHRQVLANLGPISRFVDETNSKSVYPKAMQMRIIIWKICLVIFVPETNL